MRESRQLRRLEKYFPKQIGVIVDDLESQYLIVLRSELATGETDEITGTTHCSNVLTAPTVRDLIKKFRGACVAHGFHECTNPYINDFSVRGRRLFADGCNFFHRDIGISTRPDERRWKAYRGDRRERYYLDHPRYDKITERWS